MITSNWKCPQCKHNLFISNGGDYWCTTCQQWKPAETVDPLGRDMARGSIVVGYEIEKVLYKMGDA